MKSLAASYLADIIEHQASQAPAVMGDVIDADADPLAIMRALLKQQTDAISAMPLNSARRNPAIESARGIAKAISAMERERTAKESPSEEKDRKRREDGETHARILQYVEQYEADAAAIGICVHCGSVLSPERVVELYGKR